VDSASQPLWAKTHRSFPRHKIGRVRRSRFVGLVGFFEGLGGSPLGFTRRFLFQKPLLLSMTTSPTKVETNNDEAFNFSPMKGENGGDEGFQTIYDKIYVVVYHFPLFHFFHVRLML
jgi:hypothetical protein